ncbi:serine/threonine-protein kinase [Nannocystis sp. RBIL2]|uniref:serine/threonine-protein kinase n=1 Tax=Nannocystis sp. RBIL2 TaxID=2996788 RepID=UPI00226F2268|nr:serine/threonine-protein kinase [Nannocystis sp. RBIL2]MCY1064445.1 serine/threonine-protein kinase [Nannocystis sp. RBIL2]
MTGDPALLGSVLAERWEVLDALGRGGMGTVYRARHVHLGTDVAIKVLQNTARLDASEIARFYRESRLIGSLQHDHIVRVQGTGKTPSGDLYFVMEYLRGPNLRSLLKSKGPLPWTRMRVIVLQICDALGAMHDRGVIHRDLKPQNIVLDPRPGRPDFVKLLDFGVAKPTGDDRQDLTQTGVLLGTPLYMAPEYLCGVAPDRRIDIYGLGVIAFELLTGQPPTANAAANAVTLQAAGVPTAAGNIVAQALARDPERRFADARALATALSSVPEEPHLDADETTRVRVLAPPAKLASTAAIPAPPRPQPAPAIWPAPTLPPHPVDAGAVTRREGGAVLALPPDDAPSTLVAARRRAPPLPAPTNEARAIARGGGGAAFVFSVQDPERTIQLSLEDVTQIKEARSPDAIGSVQLEASDPARSAVQESAAPVSTLVRVPAARKLARPGGTTRRIAAFVFVLAVFGFLWAIWPPPPERETTEAPGLLEPSPPAESVSVPDARPGARKRKNVGPPA